MSVSLSQLPPSALEDPRPSLLTRMNRLGRISVQQLFSAMIWLAAGNPAAFDTLLDAIDGFPAQEPGDGNEPAPFCLVCGADIGIFPKFGLDWRHYAGSSLDRLEIYDPRAPPGRLVARRPPEGLTPDGGEARGNPGFTGTGAAAIR